MRFLADENFNNRILKRLRRDLPAIDILRVQDTAIYQASDTEVLAWAAENKCILLTHDIRTIPRFAYDRVKMGLPMPGVIAVPRALPIGQAIDELFVVLGAGTPDDFDNQIKHIPLT
jgi:hypothetical protein